MKNKIRQKISNPYGKGSLSQSFRRKRFSFFEGLAAELDKPVKILDVGGNEIFWKTSHGDSSEVFDVTLLNLKEEQPKLPYVKSFAGDACNMSEFSDGEFDIVFSNSVIEHVGDMDAQRAMAKEIRRVGKRYFVQTPNRHFPVEPHYVFPFIQYLPKEVQYHIILRWPFSRNSYRNPEISRMHVEEIRLLNRKELLELFPDAQVYSEMCLGLKKSYVVYSGFKA